MPRTPMLTKSGDINEKSAFSALESEKEEGMDENFGAFW